MELSEKSSEQIKAGNLTFANIDYFKAGKKTPGKNAGEKKNRQDVKKSSGQNSSNFRTSDYNFYKSCAKFEPKYNIKCFKCGKPHLANKCTLSGSRSRLFY